MKRIINIVLLLVVALHLHGCDFLAPFLLMEFPIDNSKDHINVSLCFHNENYNSLKVVFFNEDKDSMVLDLYKENHIETGPIDIRQNKSFEQYETPWHYAIATFVGGITRCEIYQHPDNGESNLGWKGLDGNEPIFTFELGDNQPNSIFELGNWTYDKETYNCYEVQDNVVGHYYGFTIPYPSPAADE